MNLITKLKMATVGTVLLPMGVVQLPPYSRKNIQENRRK